MSRQQTILVVEDDEDLRRLFRTALTLAGYAVVEAGDGLEALHRIDQSPPDLVILDLLLPSLSGIVVRQEMAAHPTTRDIPIVIITGTATEPGGLKAACFIRKPVFPDQLVDTVRACLASGSRSGVAR